MGLSLLAAGGMRLLMLGLMLGLIPGAFAWWSGRRLLQRLDDPALPERLLERNTRLAQVVVAALVASWALLRHSGVWIVPVAVLSAMIGGYRLRRAIYEERWPLGSYLAFSVRLGLGWFGIWLFMAMAPVLVTAAGEWRWPAAAGIAAALVAWNSRYAQAFLALVGARPLAAPARFAEIIARAGIGPPGVFRFGADGGRVLFAFAVPSLRSPAVVFGDSVLDHLDLDEQAAIFAHEVAHLEHFNRRRMLAGNVVMWIVIGATTGGIALLPAHLSWIAGFVGPGVLLVFLSALVRRKTHEEASDRRAVTLCGDADALVRALVKLHVLGRMPRRWSLDIERGATHPSLARRVRAIREAAGAPAAGLPGSAVVPSATPGTLLILEPEQFVLATGVPEATPPTADAVREHARAVTSVPYGDLVELRVRAGLMGAPALVAVDRGGRRWTVRLRPQDLAAVQAALDIIDVRVSLPPAPRRGPAALGRAVSVILALATPLVGFHIAMLAAGSIGLLRPNRTTLGAVGLVAAGAAVLGAKRSVLVTHLPFTAAGWLYVASPAILLMVAAVSLWLACGRPRGELVAKFDVVAITVLMGIPVSIWLLIAGRAGTDLSTMGFLVGPDLQLAALGVAGGVFAAVRGRPSRRLLLWRRR